jgi:hypothetical protein
MAAKLIDKRSFITKRPIPVICHLPHPHPPYLSLSTTFKNFFFATTIALAFNNYFPSCEGYYSNDAVFTLSAGTFGLFA